MSRPSLVEEICLAALERVDPRGRADFLDSACRGYAGVRAEVERLLLAHPLAGQFLEPPAADDRTADFASRTMQSGSVIGGRYRLLEPIGEGGMGSVWMAQQTEPVRRLVALKLIKDGMDTRAVLARFEAERQALALMDHPNIAKVLDAGASVDGRPFFVMELVKGVPITRYCDDRKLGLRERLELFIPVCQAVQHAHQKGVIHRDLKPSNVLVAQYDDRPVPKVIDFGIAKAAGQPLTDRTLVTGFGSVVGTPEYMSPEQAQFNQLDVDTRSDIYALGVLLYELLTGSTPVTRQDFETAGLLEVLRMIREQEPPRPSTRLSTAEALPTIAANRGSEPGALPGLLRNDLDWIVMKSLEKDRNRRYETANGFAADVQRYLVGEAVQAHPPSAGYRLRKSFGKHRVAIATASAFVGILIASAGISGMLAVKARRAEAIARQRSKEAESNATEAKTNADLYRDAAERARQERNEVALSAAGLQVDLDLAEPDPHVGVLRLVRTLKTAPQPFVTRTPDGQSVTTHEEHPGRKALDEFTTLAVLATVQNNAPLLPPITHDGFGILGSSISSTGHRLLSLGSDKTARLWDTFTGRSIAILRRGEEAVIEGGFSPDGATAFTHSLDGVIRFWEAKNGAFRAETAPRPGRIKFIGSDSSDPFEEQEGNPFFPTTTKISNDRMITLNFVWTVGPEHNSHYLGPVELWDTKTGRIICQLNVHEFDEDRFGFDENGRWIYALDSNSIIKIMSSQNGQLVGELRHDAKLYNYKPYFSPSGRIATTIAFSDNFMNIYFWDTSSWKMASIAGPFLRGTTVRGPDSLEMISDTLFFIQDHNGTKEIYQSGKSIASILVLGETTPRFDGDRMLLPSGHLFDTRTWKRLQPPKGRKYHPEVSRFAPDGRFLPLLIESNQLDLVDTATEKGLGGGDFQLYIQRIGRASTTTDNSFRNGVGHFYEPRIGWVFRTRASGRTNLFLHRLPPLDQLNIPPALLELWTQVAARGELNKEGVFEKWDEPTWERKRQELASQPPPYPDFPFPGHVAADGLHWLRQEYEGAIEADKPRLARQLLDRAEAAGDRAEAVRWRTVLAPKPEPTVPPASK